MIELIKNLEKHMNTTNEDVVKHLIAGIRSWNEECDVVGVETLKQIEEFALGVKDRDHTDKKALIENIMCECRIECDWHDCGFFPEPKRLRRLEAFAERAAKQNDLDQVIWYFLSIQTLCDEPTELLYSGYLLITEESCSPKEM